MTRAGDYTYPKASPEHGAAVNMAPVRTKDELLKAVQRSPIPYIAD